LVAKGILREAQIKADICLDLREFVQEIQCGAETAIITEESLRSANVRELARWVGAQPAWGA